MAALAGPCTLSTPQCGTAMHMQCDSVWLLRLALCDIDSVACTAGYCCLLASFQLSLCRHTDPTAKTPPCRALHNAFCTAGHRASQLAHSCAVRLSRSGRPALAQVLADPILTQTTQFCISDPFHYSFGSLHITRTHMSSPDSGTNSVKVHS